MTGRRRAPRAPGTVLEGVIERHFPRVSSLDRSRHLASCEYGYWRDGKRPVPCTKNCAADHRYFDALTAEHQAPVQLELVAS